MAANYLKSYPLTLLTAVVVVALSLLPIGGPELTRDVPFADKWTHMVMYGGLTSVLWLEYWRCHRRLSWRRVAVGAVAVPILMSGTLELMQAYCTTYRSGEWMDLLANSAGVCIGAVLGLSVLRRWRRHDGRGSEPCCQSR